MGFTFSIGNQTFTGRKLRKLLCPLQFTVTYDGSPPAPVGSCAARVTFAGGTGGAFSKQIVPSLWLDAGGNSVQSPPTPFSGSFSQSYTAFAAYLYTADGGPGSRRDTADYSIQIIDATGAPVFTFPYPIAVTAEPALNKSVYFLLDRTGSMQIMSGPVTRFQRLKDAVTRGLALFTNSDRVGVISLDNLPTPTSPGGTVYATISTSGIIAAGNACTSLPPDLSAPPSRIYQTSINFARAQDATATILLVTDGLGLAPSTIFPNSPQPSPTSTLFVENPTSSKAKNNLHSSNGTYGVSTFATGEFAIEKLLSQILIDLGGLTVCSDPDGSLGPNQTHSFPLYLNETDHEVAVVLFSDQADLLNIELNGPGLLPSRHDAQSPGGPHQGGPHQGGPHQDGPYQDGPHQDGPYQDGPYQDGPYQDDCKGGNTQPEPKKVLVLRRRLSGIRPDVPHDGPSHTLVVSRAGNRESQSQARATFTFSAAVESDLMLDAYASSSGPEVGADLLFSVRLTEYELPVRHRKGVTVVVELRHPDGGIEELPLHECSPGHFEASRRAFRPGVYIAHFIVSGRTLLHHRWFRREALRSVLILESGASDPCCSAEQSSAGSR